MTNKTAKTLIVSILMISATSIIADESNKPQEEEPMPQSNCNPYPLCDITGLEVSISDEKTLLWSNL